MKISKITQNTKIIDLIIMSKVILCNKATHLEIYDFNLSLLSTLNLSFFVKKIIKFTEDILIFVGSCKYEIIVLECDINNNFFNLVRIGGQNEDLVDFTKYHVWSNIIVLYDYKTFFVYYFCKDKLVQECIPNDIDFFKLLHFDFCGNILNVVARDIEDTTYVLKYNNKLVLTKKLKKPCTSIFSFCQGTLFIGDGIIWYEINNKKVSESEFGNTKVKSYAVLSSCLILSMWDDELIKINICEDLAIHVKVYKMNSFDELHKVKNYLLGHTRCGVCYLFTFINNDLKIIQSIDSVSNLSKSFYNDKKLYFYNNKFKSILSNFQHCELIKYTTISNLRDFYIFQDIFIAVKEDATEFYNFSLKNSSFDLCSDLKPLNFNVQGFYEFDNSLFFYSKKKIIRLTQKKLKTYEFTEEILFCSFFEDNFVCYTSCGKIKTKNFIKECLEVSCILLYNNLIYFSTYNDEFFTFDLSLNEISRVKQFAFRMGIVINNLLCFIDMNNVLFLYSVQNCNFTRIGQFDEIYKMVCTNNLFLIGKYTVMCNESFSEKTTLDIKNIQAIHFYKNNYYVFLKDTVFIVKFTISTYKYQHDKNIFQFVHKEGSKICSIDYNGTFKYKKINKKSCVQKMLDNTNILSGEYKNKVYTFLTDEKMFRFNTRTKNLTQESCNNNLIAFSGGIKVSYNELSVDKKIIKYDKGAIKNVCIKEDKILIVDFFYGAYLYDINNGWTSLINKGIDCYENKRQKLQDYRKLIKKKYYLSYIWKDYYLLSDDENIIAINSKSGVICSFKINEKVVCFSEDSLEVNASVLYCVTEGNCVWKIEQV